MTKITQEVATSLRPTLTTHRTNGAPVLISRSFICTPYFVTGSFGPRIDANTVRAPGVNAVSIYFGCEVGTPAQYNALSTHLEYWHGLQALYLLTL